VTDAEPPRPGVSVVVPAFGEAARIASTINELRETLGSLDGDGLEVVVVDDGSHDETAKVASQAGADKVVRFPANRGKGAAVRAGLLAAHGRVLAFTDADLSYPPAQLSRLVQEVNSGWDMVVGSRRHIETRTLVRAGRLREVAGRVFNTATRLVLDGKYGDTQCGLKAFAREPGQRLAAHGRIDGFAFDVELFMLAERFGLRVREVPVELRNAEGSTVRMASDPVKMLRDLLRLRRWSRNGTYDHLGTSGSLH
jgi:dolichyl-phosphate beta-glucosyltransferase